MCDSGGPLISVNVGRYDIVMVCEQVAERAVVRVAQGKNTVHRGGR